jgi:hypothetical protein
MGKFFVSNINGRGRLARAAWGLTLIGIGIAVFQHSFWGALLLVAAGIFALFEAARGWCIMRACGIRTWM